MLLGNDPFQEQYRWTRVFSFLIALALAMTFFAGLGANYSENPDGLTISFSLIYVVIGILTFLGIMALLLVQRRSFKLLCQRRELVLSGRSFPRAEQQPVASAEPMALPQQVRKRLRRGISTTAIVLLILYAISQILRLLPVLVPDPYALPDLVFESNGMLLAVIIFSLIYSGMVLLSAATTYYMLPALDIDDNGITAHYGQRHITLAWQDIRYFALSNNKQIANSRTAVKTFVYEICDGKNIINWMPGTRAAATYRVDHPNYNTLASEQLPMLIARRTGLPLLDLRQIK